MKAIFTYPNNAATSYIDPLYVGDASDGFQKRIQDLKDGNYLPWAGTAPVDTVSDLMSNISKFNDYYMDRGEYQHVSIHDMYLYPLLTGTITTQQHNDITATITASDINGHFTSVGHGLTQGDVIAASLFNGDYSVLNGNNYYVQYTNVDTFRLSVDAGMTEIVSLYELKEANVAYSNEYVLGTTTPHNMSDGMPVTLSGLNGSWSVFNGLEVYAKVDSSQALKFTTDAAGTILYKVHELANADVTSSTDFVLTTASPHQMTTGLLVDISGLSGTWAGFNGTQAYAYNNGSNSLMLTQDAAGNNSIGIHNLGNADITSSVLGQPMSFNASNDLVDGMHVDISGFDGSMEDYNSTSGYVRNRTASDFNLSVTPTGNLIGYDSNYTAATYNPNIIIIPEQRSGALKFNIQNATEASQANLNTIDFGSPTYGLGGSALSNLGAMNIVNTNVFKEYELLRDGINILTLDDILNDADCDDCTFTINKGGTTVNMTGWTQPYYYDANVPTTRNRPQVFEDNPVYVTTTEGGMVSQEILWIEEITTNPPSHPQQYVNSKIYSGTYRLYTDKAKTQLASDWSGYTMSQTGHFDLQDMSPYWLRTSIFDDSGMYDLTQDTGRAGLFTSAKLIETNKTWTQAQNNYLADQPPVWTNTPFSKNISGPLTNGSNGPIVLYNGEYLYKFTNTGSGFNDWIDTSVYTFDITRITAAADQYGTISPYSSDSNEVIWYADDTGDCHTMVQAILATTPNPTGEQQLMAPIYCGILANKQVYIQIQSYDAVAGRYYLTPYSNNELKDSVEWEVGGVIQTTRTIQTNAQLHTPQYNIDIPAEDITNFVFAVPSSDGTSEVIIVPKQSWLTYDAHFKIEAPNVNENKVQFTNEYNVSGVPTTNNVILPVATGTIPNYEPTGDNPLWGNLKTGMRVIYNTKTYVVMQSTSSTTEFQYVDINNEKQIISPGSREQFYLFDIADDRTSDFLIDLNQKETISYADNVNGSQYILNSATSELMIEDWSEHTTLHTPAWVTRNVGLTRNAVSSMSGKLIVPRVGDFEINYMTAASTTGNVIEIDTTPSWVIAETGATQTTTGYIEEVYTSQGAWDQTTTNFISSTTGDIDEVDTTPSWVYASANPVLATSGQAFYDAPDTYDLTAIDLIIPGDADYTYKNASNVTTPGAEVTSTYQNTSGTSFAHPGTPNITLTTDAQGRISAATLNAPLTGYSAAEDIVFGIQELPDQYVPPAPNTAAMEDYFAINNAWTNLSGYQGAGKMFAKDIIPTSASITYVQPSTTNMSQNGRKYVRSSGFVKTKLEVNYTNLTKAEFQELHADAQAARGQAATFYLVVALWGGKVLNFYQGASRSNPRLVTPYVAGETLLKLGGFNSNEQDVFKKGEMIIGNNGNENGDLLTVLNTVDANVYGEAEIRVAYGNPSSANNGTKIFKNPYWIVVSLDSDEFQYTVDTFGLYNVTVGFETGSYT